MALSALDDKSVEPTSGELARVLGPSEELWYHLISQMEAGYGPLSEAWSFAGAKYGWSLRLKQKNLVALFPVSLRCRLYYVYQSLVGPDLKMFP